MNGTNILFLVWDCARRDIVQDIATNLNSVAESNLRFENAIAPAHWSLPSHVSLFSGVPPSKHEVYNLDSTIDGLPAVSALSSQGYTTYAVSANPFINESFGFDAYFDHFCSTVPDDWYEHSSQQNTTEIERILTAEAEHDRPFFLFANYMAAHHPYDPPANLQEDKLDRDNLWQINEEHTPVNFMKRVYQGDVEPDALEQVRSLYEGEIEAADHQLGVILDTLEKTGLRDETLIILTADHGENLGEADERGKRRMGHTESVSDYLFRVPLVVAHPELEAQNVTRMVELKNVASLVESLPDDRITSERLIEQLSATDDVAVAECPADGGYNHIDESNYSELPDFYVENLSFTHTCVGYAGEWKMVVTSSGEQQAWEEGRPCAVEHVPEHLVQRVVDQLDDLQRTDSLDTQTEFTIDEDTRSNLEDLGYL